MLVNGINSAPEESFDGFTGSSATWTDQMAWVLAGSVTRRYCLLLFVIRNKALLSE